MYKIKLTKIAAEHLQTLDKATLKQVFNTIESLKKAPHLLGKPLKGPLKEFRSIRAAGQRYRIIYRVLHDEVIVVVIAVGIRKESDKKDIYELMKKYLKIGLMNNTGTGSGTGTG
jgi:mRNA interferase RelE/StbE